MPNFDWTSWAKLEPDFNVHIHIADADAAWGAANALILLLNRCGHSAEHPNLRGLPAGDVAAAVTAAMRRHRGQVDRKGRSVEWYGCVVLHRLCQTFGPLRAELRRDPAVLRTLRAAAEVWPFLETRHEYRELCGWLAPSEDAKAQPAAAVSSEPPSEQGASSPATNQTETSVPASRAEKSPAIQAEERQSKCITELKTAIAKGRSQKVNPEALKEDAPDSPVSSEDAKAQPTAAVSSEPPREQGASSPGTNQAGHTSAAASAPQALSCDQGAIPSGEGTRVAMFSARFDGGEMEMKFREVHKILLANNYNVLMVDVRAGENFGKLTTRYLNRVYEESGTLLAVCTANYGEKTASAHSSHEELIFALDNKDRVQVLPLRVVDTYPPQPPFGPDHPYDKEGDARGLVRRLFPPSTVFQDCRKKSEIQIAAEIAERLRAHRVSA